MVAHAPKLKARKDVDAQLLDVPAGLNETAVMALRRVARTNGAPRPRRLFYVVDRRAVADEATELVERLSELDKALSLVISERKG